LAQVMACVLALLLVVLSPLNKAKALTINQVLDKVQRFYETIHSLKASFVQKVTLPEGKIEVSYGKVWIEKPGKMKWIYERPERFFIVSNGKKIYIYYPEEKQVLVFPYKKSISSKLALEFINGRAKIEKDLKLESFKVLNENYWKLNFIPFKKDSLIEKLSLTVNLNTGEVREISLVQSTGEKIDLLFKKIAYNIELPPNFFYFKPPQGSEIIEEW